MPDGSIIRLIVLAASAAAGGRHASARVSAQMAGDNHTGIPPYAKVVDAGVPSFAADLSKSPGFGGEDVKNVGRFCRSG